MDGISSTLLKKAMKHDGFSHVVHYLLSISILTNTVPTSWKTSKIKALFKGHNKDPGKIESFRCIASVPALSKGIEHILATQIMEPFENNNLFPSDVFGYRKNIQQLYVLFHGTLRC